VRVSEGRAKKVEGNPLHPVNRGKLCARGQAILQELYHPDRVAQPLKRTGVRGSGEFQRISWTEGLALLTGRLTVASARKRLPTAWLS
jgi:anaerobic selenocysteine-containing dehydrogenase